MKRAMATTVLLGLSLAGAEASASRWYSRDTTRPDDMRGARPAAAREHLPMARPMPALERVFTKLDQRGRPGESGMRSGVKTKDAKAVNPKAVGEGVLAKQHDKKGQGVLDAAMLKHSKGHASSRESNGGSSSRDFRRGVARALKVAKSGDKGLLDRLYLKQIRIRTASRMKKKTSRLAIHKTATREGGDAKASAGSEGLMDRLAKKQALAIVKKQLAKHTHAEGK